MIHVFNCAKDVCALPGKACVECGKVCSQINCEPCKQCCDECGKVVSSFWDRPLSTYVALKVIMAAAQIYFCASALSDESLKSCNAEAKGGWVSGETWVQIQMLGFAIVHLLFAPYFQSRVWRMVSEKLREGQFRLEPGFVVPQQIIFASFKEVFLYDLGILFYAMILCASFVWSRNGSSSMTGGFCDPGGNCGSASYLGLCFFWLVVYNFCYYFCGCCASSVQLTDPDTELALYQAVGRR